MISYPNSQLEANWVMCSWGKQELEKEEKQPSVWHQVGRRWCRRQSNHSKQKGHPQKLHLKSIEEALWWRRTKKTIMMASCVFFSETILFGYVFSSSVQRSELNVNEVNLPVLCCAASSHGRENPLSDSRVLSRAPMFSLFLHLTVFSFLSIFFFQFTIF